MGSQQLEIDVAKEFLFTLREVGLETEALQGAYYKGLTPVPQDQQVPLGKLRVRGHCWKEALAECEEFREAYKQGKETPGQVTDAEVKEVFKDFKVEAHLPFIKLQASWRSCVQSDRMCRQYLVYHMQDRQTAGHIYLR